MTDYLITCPPTVSGSVELPLSKSISNRVLLLEALCGHDIPTATAVSDCDDTRVMFSALTRYRNGSHASFDIEGAGTAMRFLTAFFSAQEGCDVFLTGNARMQQRPIGLLVDALRQLGAVITYTVTEGYPPLHIRGRQLIGDNVHIDSSVSSQYISALMMIAPLTTGHDSVLRIGLDGEKVVSRPYIDMTTGLMAEYGIAVHNLGNALEVERTAYRHTGEPYAEADWSAASYWLGMEQIARKSGKSWNVAVTNLRDHSLQGDKCVYDMLHRDTKAMPSELDFTGCPDMVQTVAVAYCLTGQTFRFTGIGNLRIKETDRVAALVAELKRLGYGLQATDDTLCWDGTRCAACPDDIPAINTYGDHRIAMAFAMTAVARGQVVIRQAEVVSKSYPTFWDDMRSCGFTIREV